MWLLLVIIALTIACIEVIGYYERKQERRELDEWIDAWNQRARDEKGADGHL